MALQTKFTETISMHFKNLNSKSQFKEYQNVLNMLADNGSIIYNYALEETIRLTESLVGCGEFKDKTDDMVIEFVSQAAKHLSEYKWIHYGESNARLELLLRAMSSVLHIVSNSGTMLESDIRDSLYKSVSKYWQIYRNTNSINANVIFTLREIRTCLRKIRDDSKSRTNAVISKGGGDIIANVVQKETLDTLLNFNFEYAAGTWYYKWKNRRENYFVLRRKYLEDTSNPRIIKRFYKKLHKSSIREFENVKRRNTTYRNFEYKVLKSGGVITECSLPDHIDTLLIGYLSLTQRLLEEFFTQTENYVKKTITFCNEIIETSVKKQLTFKAVEILYIIKENSKKEEIKDEIKLKFENWFNCSQPPQHKLDDTLITPTSHEGQEEKQKQRHRINVLEIMTPLSNVQKVRNTRKRIVDDVIRLFEERRKVCENIENIKAEYELLNNNTIDKDLFLMKLKEILEEREKERKNNESGSSVRARSAGSQESLNLFNNFDKEDNSQIEVLDDPLVNLEESSDSDCLNPPEIINNIEQVDEKDNDQEEYGESEESDSHDVSSLEVINNNEQVDEKDNDQEEYGKSEESDSHDVNSLINNNEKVDEKDNDQEKYGKSEESNSRDINLSEITNNNKQVETNSFEKKGTEIDGKDNNQEKCDERYDESEERRSDSHDVNPPEIIVEEIGSKINEEDDVKIENNVIINQYHIINNVINIQQSDQMNEEDAFLVKTLRRIAKSIEYIADQAVKGHQAALRLSNNNSSSSVNEINENKKEIEMAEEEKEVEKAEEEKEVEKVESKPLNESDSQQSEIVSL